MANLKHSLRSYIKTPIFSLEKNFISFSGNLYRKIAIVGFYSNIFFPEISIKNHIVFPQTHSPTQNFLEEFLPTYSEILDKVLLETLPILASGRTKFGRSRELDNLIRSSFPASLFIFWNSLQGGWGLHWPSFCELPENKSWDFSLTLWLLLNKNTQLTMWSGVLWKILKSDLALT